MGYRNPGHPTPCPHCVSPPTLLPSEKAMVAHVHTHHPSLAPFACLAGCGRFFKSKPGALKHSGTCKPPAPPPQHQNDNQNQNHAAAATASSSSADKAAKTPTPDFRAARKECPTCGTWLASAGSLARHRRTTACGGRKRVWVGEGPDPRGAAAATATATPEEGGDSMRHGNRWKRSWVVVDEGRDEAEVRGEEPAAIAGRKRRFAEERRPVEGEGKRAKRSVERAPRGRNREKKQEIVEMMGVWSLQKREGGGREQEREHKQEEFQEHVWNLQMEEVKPEEIQERVEDRNEDDEEIVVVRFPMAGKRLPSTVSPPRKTISGKTVPGKAVPSKTVPGKTVPRKTVPRKTVPQSKNEESEDKEGGMEDSETEESEVEVAEWKDESDDDGEESEWDEEDYM